MNKAFLIDVAITAAVVVVTMTLVNRTPLKGYVAGDSKILGVL